jgi:hypothetical protein
MVLFHLSQIDVCQYTEHRLSHCCFLKLNCCHNESILDVKDSFCYWTLAELGYQVTSQLLRLSTYRVFLTL